MFLSSASVNSSIKGKRLADNNNKRMAGDDLHTQTHTCIYEHSSAVSLFRILLYIIALNRVVKASGPFSCQELNHTWQKWEELS